MIDKTSRDVRLGDISSIDATGTVDPRVDGEVLAVTGTSSRKAPVLGSPDAGLSTTQAHVTAGSLTGKAAPARTGIPVSGGNGFSWPLVALSVFVVLLLGAVVLLLLEQRSLAAQLTVLQDEARKSVETLENRVASTNTTLKSTDSETQRSLNIIAADISRLDKSLAKFAAALEQESKNRAALDGALKSFAVDTGKALQAGAQATSQAEAKLDSRLKTLADNLDQLNARLKTQAEGLAKLERSNEAAQLRSEVAVLGASLRQLQDDHDKRLKSIEQVAGSNDAFRRQVNATIDRLNQQVTELYQRR